MSSFGKILPLFLLALVSFAAPYRYSPEHRKPVDVAIQHLKGVAANNTYSPKEMRRYDLAMTDLSQFAEKLQKGVFDKSKLDKGIGGIQTILSKNPLDGKARDLLNRDVLELRRLRSTYDLGYRYNAGR